MTKEREFVVQLRDLLSQVNDHRYDGDLGKALAGDEGALWKFLVSNTMWGGAGSIADEAPIDNAELKGKLYDILIGLGDLQIQSGKVNERTEMWVSAYKQWKAQGIV